MATIKTAISIPESVFRKAERLSRKMGITRSRFFSRAAEDYIRRCENRRILRQLNDAYEEPPSPQERAALGAARANERRRVKGTW